MKKNDMRRKMLIKKKVLCTGWILIMAVLLASCRGQKNVQEVNGQPSQERISESSTECDITENHITENDVTENHITENNNTETVTTQSAATEKTNAFFHFVDVFGQEYQTVINERVRKHSYRPEAFVREGDRLRYEDEEYSSRLGVDVSHHQGNIDWQKVKASGIDFAFVRLGYRGYGEEGAIGLDREFERNVEEAKAAGIEVGVYFFAQAVNEQEAKEEAEFVLQHLQQHTVTLPVVYDPESILNDTARTDGLTGEQFTKNTIAFCEEVKKAGYQPMVYANMLWEAFMLDLERLPYPLWYADYEPLPQTPYYFDYWQYTNEGRVAGIEGNVDMNIQFIRS